MTYKRYLVPLAAAAVLGVMLPTSPGAAAEKKPAFSGYNAEAWSAPVKIELYEPTIPIPADPQLEVELGYSTIEADSGSSKARASWLWPGDPVGEGLKTFVTQLGLPEQLGEAGYPVQVNAAQPSGEAAQADEPFPGTVMRTSATEDKTVAQVGFSPDSAVNDGAAAEGGGQDGGEGTPGIAPGASGGSGGSGGSGADALQQFGQAITGALGQSQNAAAESPAAPGTPGLPPELAALVDLEGYTSSSQSVATDAEVVSTARSALGNVSLLGGAISLDGLVVTSSSSSDGKTGAPVGKARLGGLTVAGQEFSFGPDGAVAAGQAAPLPAVPAEAAQALAQLGVHLVLPKPGLERKGDLAESDLAGLRVEIDTAVLRDQLDALPLDDLVGAVPAEAGQLKSLLHAVVGLSPRIVITLGNAGTSADTVQGLKIPTDIPDNDPAGDKTPAAAGAPAGGSGGAPSTGGGLPAGGAPSAAGGDAPAATDDLGDAALAGSGLPPLYTSPGAILVGGLALGALGGTWLRRAGVLALGGAGSCAHGLDRGLPDLRKAR